MSNGNELQDFNTLDSGEIMKNIAGDPYDDGGRSAKSEFTKGGTVKVHGKKTGKV